jgi:LA2681-like HEPN
MLRLRETRKSLYNTLDYPTYSVAIEKVKAAYRLAYSLFDKIAFFLNAYLDLLPIPSGNLGGQKEAAATGLKGGTAVLFRGTPPSQPRASARSRGSACDPHGAQKQASSGA